MGKKDKEKNITLNSEPGSKVIRRLVTMHHTYTSTKRSIVSELQTLLRTVRAWYGTLVRLVRPFKQRTNIPYPYLHNKRVPFFSAKIEAYCNYVAYRTAILGGYRKK